MPLTCTCPDRCVSGVWTSQGRDRTFQVAAADDALHPPSAVRQPDVEDPPIPHPEPAPAGVVGDHLDVEIAGAGGQTLERRAEAGRFRARTDPPKITERSS